MAKLQPLLSDYIWAISDALHLHMNPHVAPKAAWLPDSVPPESPGSSCPHARSAHPSAHSFCQEFAPLESRVLQISGRRTLRPSHTPFARLSASPHPFHPRPTLRAARNRPPS